MPIEPQRYATGPFRADQLRPGAPYELHNGHPIECLPSGGWHAKTNVTAWLAHNPPTSGQEMKR